jgi:hypothetical protein
LEKYKKNLKETRVSIITEKTKGAIKNICKNTVLKALFHIQNHPDSKQGIQH